MGKAGGEGHCGGLSLSCSPRTRSPGRRLWSRALALKNNPWPSSPSLGASPPRTRGRGEDRPPLASRERVLKPVRSFDESVALEGTPRERERERLSARTCFPVVSTEARQRERQSEGEPSRVKEGSPPSVIALFLLPPDPAPDPVFATHTQLPFWRAREPTTILRSPHHGPGNRGAFLAPWTPWTYSRVEF